MQIPTEILAKLVEIERLHQVKIVLAVVSGSQAQGLSSPSSDYDVHFVFTHPFERYVSVSGYKTYLGSSEEGANGHELGEIIRLLAKSAYNQVEDLYCPIITEIPHHNPLVLEALRRIAARCYQPSQGFKHAVGHSFQYTKRYYAAKVAGEERPQLKAAAGALRLVTTAKFALKGFSDPAFSCPPPVDFRALYKTVYRGSQKELDMVERLLNARRADVYDEALLTDVVAYVEQEQARLKTVAVAKTEMPVPLSEFDEEYRRLLRMIDRCKQ